ncbi:hypothetical protein LKX83_04390 [Cohnella sp. REN36]|nr:hypothetical protein [Cohnella sp. REN36]
MTTLKAKFSFQVVNNVNSVSDVLSNGIITFILEIMNLALHLRLHVRHQCKVAHVILGGLPTFIVIMLLIKTKRRRAWKAVSNKNPNLNTYLQESISDNRFFHLPVRQLPQSVFPS